MIGKQQKLAFLLDFDGPFFNNDLVKNEILSFFGMREDQWKEAYKKASDNGKYTDYGKIIKLLAEQSTAQPNMLWKHLVDVMQDERFCSKENRQALAEFARLGHVEVITQGEGEYQWTKLIASGIDEIIERENKRKGDTEYKHSVCVIETNKNVHLRARFAGLVEDGYSVVQIDDRVGPLHDITQFAEQQGLGSQLMQIRIQTGKYKEKELNPPGCPWLDCSSIAAALETVSRVARPPYSPEGGGIRYR